MIIWLFLVLCSYKSVNSLCCVVLYSWGCIFRVNLQKWNCCGKRICSLVRYQQTANPGGCTLPPARHQGVSVTLPAVCCEAFEFLLVLLDEKCYLNSFNCSFFFNYSFFFLNIFEPYFSFLQFNRSIFFSFLLNFGWQLRRTFPCLGYKGVHTCCLLVLVWFHFPGLAL